MTDFFAHASLFLLIPPHVFTFDELGQWFDDGIDLVTLAASVVLAVYVAKSLSGSSEGSDIHFRTFRTRPN